MANELLRAFTVFVASPGGVDAERATVDKVANTLNSRLAARFNVALIIKRFEQQIGGAGNPQAQINPGVDDADLFIGIIHRRWGTATGNGFDSGFAEEFDRALKRWQTTGRPRIAVFFKSIDTDSLEDPGEQLAKVLTFKRRLEADHEAFYNSFGSTDEFAALVTQLLAEEVMGNEPSAPGEGAIATTEVRGNGLARLQEPISEEVASVLFVYSEILLGRYNGETLDADRLELFALAVSRDDDPLPNHLANRLFARRDQITLSGIERRAWFRSYVNDIGRSSSRLERVIPFATAVGGRQSVAELVTQYSTEFIGLDQEWLRDGSLRLLTALSIRPRDLWPKGALDTAQIDALRRAWSESAGSSASMKLAIDYWLSVRRDRDHRLAVVLASSKEERLSEFGAMLTQLLSKQPKATLLAEVMPEMLSAPLVRALFDNQNPLATLSVDELEKIASKNYSGIDLRLDALGEMTRRNEVTEKILLSTLGEQGLGSIFTNSWVEAASVLLYDRETTIEFMRTFTSAFKSKLEGSDAEPKRQIRMLIARMAQHSDALAEVSSTLFDLDGTVDPERLGNALRRYQGSDALADVAGQVVSGTYSKANEYLNQLEQAGAEVSTLDFVRRKYESAALRYLSHCPTPKIRNKYAPRIRESAADEKSWQLDHLGSLLNLIEDRDIDLIVARATYMDEPLLRRAVGEAVRVATLTRLRSLIHSDNEQFVLSALRELDRRGRPPSQSVLGSLLRDERAAVRMEAISMLLKASQKPQIERILTAYFAGDGTHYYNVICEVDRALSDMPAT